MRVTRKVCALEHLHAGEQPLEVLADDVLERDEALVAERHEPGEDRRHLDPGEVLLAGLRGCGSVTARLSDSPEM